MVYVSIVIAIIVLDLLYLILDSALGVPATWYGKVVKSGMENNEYGQTSNSAGQNQYVRSGDSDVQTSGIVIILSVLFPIVGIILGCIYIPSYNETRRHAGKTYLKASLITIGVGFALYLISIFVIAKIILP